MNQCLHGRPGVNPWFDWRLKKKKHLFLYFWTTEGLSSSFLAFPCPNPYCSVMDGLMREIWNSRLAAMCSKDVGCWMNRTATSFLKWGWAPVTCRWFTGFDQLCRSQAHCRRPVRTRNESSLQWTPTALLCKKRIFSVFYGQTSSKELIFEFLKAHARYTLGSSYTNQPQIYLQIFSIFLC